MSLCTAQVHFQGGLTPRLDGVAVRADAMASTLDAGQPPNELCDWRVGTDAECL